MGEPNRSKTARGFDVYDTLEDSYGNIVSVTQSSAAQIEGDPAGPWVWIQVQPCGDEPGERMRAGHLDPQAARRVRDALAVWLQENVNSQVVAAGDALCGNVPPGSRQMSCDLPRGHGGTLHSATHQRKHETRVGGTVHVHAYETTITWPIEPIPLKDPPAPMRGEIDEA